MASRKDRTGLDDGPTAAEVVAFNKARNYVAPRRAPIVERTDETNLRLAAINSRVARLEHAFDTLVSRIGFAGTVKVAP
jgi:hypothetical protein